MNKVAPNIFQGDWASSLDEEQLIRNNIKFIITLNQNYKPQNVLNMYKRLGIKYMHIYLSDNIYVNIKKYFQQTNNYIKSCIDNNSNILVHCTAGISRATTIVLAYLLYEHHMKCSKKYFVLPKLLFSIKKCRPQVVPNIGFLKQLSEYENELIENKHSKEICIIH